MQHAMCSYVVPRMYSRERMWVSRHEGKCTPRDHHSQAMTAQLPETVPQAPPQAPVAFCRNAHAHENSAQRHMLSVATG